MALTNLSNNPNTTIEIRSDSMLVIDSLNGTKKCQDETLAKKRDLILQHVKALPCPVEFVWRPRNSTPELKEANYLAQDAINVPRH